MNHGQNYFPQNFLSSIDRSHVHVNALGMGKIKFGEVCPHTKHDPWAKFLSLFSCFLAIDIGLGKLSVSIKGRSIGARVLE